MIVHEAGRLHERITNGRAYKTETAPLQRGAQFARLFRGRGKFAAKTAPIVDRPAVNEAPNERIERADVVAQAQQRARVADRCLDLCAVAHDAGVAKQLLHARRRDARYGGGLKAGKHFPVARTFLQNGLPREAGLRPFEYEQLEKGSIVMERHTPLVVMVSDQQRSFRPVASPRFRLVAVAAALVTLIVHLIANPHYGFFRDELYFVICGFRPAWGYVDQPPVVPLLAAGSQLFGHSLFLLRAVPAFFAAACVFTTCLLVVELGGGIFAEFFAGLVAIVTPVLMHFGSTITTDIVGLWLWPLAALYVLRIAKGGDPRYWLAIGAIVGISFESKYSVAFFAAALFVGLLATPQRRALATPWFVAGALLAAALELPNFVWQASHAYPMWTLLRDADEYKNVQLGAPQYVATQFLILHPLLAPVSFVGLIALLRRADARFLGIAYLALIAQMIALHGKDYYPGAFYPVLIAAGAVTIEAWTESTAVWRPALAAYTVLAGALLVPLLMPVLPEQTMLAYDRVAQTMLAREVSLAKMERTTIGKLPPDWADMHGWRELAALVARVYYSLPPDQRGQAAILASNYGEAAAIDFFGSEYGLPPVLSGHNQYWLWGTRGYTGNVVIDVHGDCDRDGHLFRTRHVVARFSNPWGRPFENGFPISICKNITAPLAAVWPKLRNYN